MSDRAANDTINRQDSIEVLNKLDVSDGVGISSVACDLQKKAIRSIKNLPSVQPEIIRCHECKHNPKYEWFGCPMSHLSEVQRPETAWCWKAERRTNE